MAKPGELFLERLRITFQAKGGKYSVAGVIIAKHLNYIKLWLDQIWVVLRNYHKPLNNNCSTAHLQLHQAVTLPHFWRAQTLAIILFNWKHTLATTFVSQQGLARFFTSCCTKFFFAEPFGSFTAMESSPETHALIHLNTAFHHTWVRFEKKQLMYVLPFFSPVSSRLVNENKT